MRPSRSWHVRGNDSPCAVCSRTISAHEFEHGLEFSGNPPLHLVFHTTCLDAWYRAGRALEWHEGADFLWDFEDEASEGAAEPGDA